MEEAMLYFFALAERERLSPGLGCPRVVDIAPESIGNFLERSPIRQAALKIEDVLFQRRWQGPIRLVDPGCSKGYEGARVAP
jgi:hypothetical protein